MKKLYVVSLSLFLCIILAWPVGATEGITYSFDDVEVVFAAEFTVNPVSAQDNNWFTDLAGGQKEPLQILYGVVDLMTDGSPDWREEFIKVSGPNGSERFLANSYSTKWYDEKDGAYNHLQSSRTFFWSAKKLEENTVVKDFSGQIQSVILQKDFDENQNLTSIKLSFSNDGLTEAQNFGSSEWEELSDNVYLCDVSTLKTAGNPAAARK